MMFEIYFRTIQHVEGKELGRETKQIGHVLIAVELGDECMAVHNSIMPTFYMFDKFCYKHFKKLF